MKTYSTRGSEIKREWHVVDAAGKPVGRLATEIVHLLRGKHKPIYSRHLDTGDFVIVVNAEKAHVTGSKGKKKVYYRYSGYPGGIRAETFERMIETHPAKVIEHAVRGMLPKNVLGRAMFRKLKIYEGPSHPHQAQTREGSKGEEG
ncbi:MAG: 50S ribosomal protein L13 [Chloroflexi bacterium]|nr:50S ribosomal protein L13 [Chloroflexota bacterium]